MSGREDTSEVAPAADEEPRLSERLGDSHVGLRGDLQVFRHLFRGEPTYVVRDPMTMQSHRFDRHDYAILVRIQQELSLGALFSELVEEGRLRTADEEDFFRFVVELHQLAFLTLPVPNDRLLYKRYVQKQRARRMQRVKGFLFLKVPIFNPNAFLDRTQNWVRPLFSRPFFLAWLGMLGVSLFIAVQNADSLMQPSHSVLGSGNLAFMWIALIGLKLVHEFGHAYACKLRGGEVPEMGAFLVVFTPLAYVDATSSWSFVSRRDRVVVSLAGVYVESIFAMIALFVWLASESSLIRMVAHDVMLLASVVTLIANVNPLMRFDGYYLLSDLLEVPNLRARAEQRVRSVAKRLVFGIPAPEDGYGRGMHWFLAGFGFAAAIYRVVLVLSISVLIATKAFLLGILVAASYAGGQIVAAVRSLVGYLLYSEETRAHRPRAVALGMALLVILPLGLLLVPVPGSIHVSGQIGREFEDVIVARQSGFVESVEAKPGDRVEAGSLLVRLEDRQLHDQLSEAEASFELARLRARALDATDPGRARGARGLVEAHAVGVARRRAELDELALRSRSAGVVVSGLTDSDLARFVERSEPVATVASGSWQIRALMRADELAETRPAAGQEVTLRAPAAPGRSLRGTVRSVAPAGSRSVELAALTQAGGGDIPVDAESLEADQPYFELVVELADDAAGLRHGMTGHVQLAAAAEPLAVSGVRGARRVFNRISRD